MTLATMTGRLRLPLALWLGLTLAACGSDANRASIGDAGDGDTVGDGDGDGDGDTVGDGGGGDEPTCGASPFEADRVPANLLLLIDKSGSMDKTPDGFTRDKWTALTDTLDASLRAVQDDLSFGVDLFPVGDSSCELPDTADITEDVRKGADHVEAIVATLKATTPSGSTPTAAALSRALTYYKSGAGATLQGDRYVLLATDGGPNCNDSLACPADACTVNLAAEGACGGETCCDESYGGPGAGKFCVDDGGTLTAVEALSNAGIPTVVVGIPGSEAFGSLLDALAAAGGMPNVGNHDYFAVTADGSGAGGLADVLDSITRQLIRTCDLQLAKMPPDLGRLNVELDGKTIPRDADDGWVLDTDTDPPTVRLQGDTCNAIKTDGAMSVQVTFGCPTAVLL